MPPENFARSLRLVGVLKILLTIRLGWKWLWAVAFFASSGIACDLPEDLRDNPAMLPGRVQQRFCQPPEGFHSLLLIRTAINEDAPVYRIIAIRKNSSDVVADVRLFQFDQHGNDHPEVSGENQAVIDFEVGKVFKAQVKGKKTTVSFVDQSFEFTIHGVFGLRIRQPVNAEGNITAAGKATNVLLIRTSDKDEWQWICHDSERVRF